MITRRIWLTVLLSAAVCANEITKWNTLLLNHIVSDAIPPPKASKALAMLHVAQFEAINALSQDCEPYFDAYLPVGANAVAQLAAAYAGHDIMLALFPDDADALAQQLQGSLVDTTPDGPAVMQSQALGSAAARAVLIARTDDNSDDPYAYTPPTPTPAGDWRPSPPNYRPYLLPHWGLVTPWALQSGSQFRQPEPPRPTQTVYEDELQAVFTLGGTTSAARTADQSDIAVIWEGDPGTVTPPGFWFQIAQELTVAHEQTLAESARMFAVLGIAVADAGIACWDTKFTYKSWRPVSAIRESGLDANFTPYITTPPFPAYVSGHSTFSSAASTVLTALLGSDAQDFELTAKGVTRRYSSLFAAAQEASMSRIYGGIHLQADADRGVALGISVGEQALQRCVSVEAQLLTETAEDEMQQHHGILVAALVFAILAFVGVIILLIAFFVSCMRKQEGEEKPAETPGEEKRKEGIYRGHYQSPFVGGRQSSVAYAGVQQSTQQAGQYFWPLCGLLTCIVMTLVAIPIVLFLFGMWRNALPLHHTHFT